MVSHEYNVRNKFFINNNEFTYVFALKNVL